MSNDDHWQITRKSMRVKIFHIVLFQHEWNIGRLIKKNSLQSIHRLSIWERSRYNTTDFKLYLANESTLVLFFFFEEEEEECIEKHGTLCLYKTYQTTAANTYLQKTILLTARRETPTLTLPPICNVWNPHQLL